MSIFTEYDNGGGQTGFGASGFAAYNKLFTSYSREMGKLASDSALPAQPHPDSLHGLPQ